VDFSRSLHNQKERKKERKDRTNKERKKEKTKTSNEYTPNLVACTQRST
jgi:hypothetical protein